MTPPLAKAVALATLLTLLIWQGLPAGTSEAKPIEDQVMPLDIPDAPPETLSQPGTPPAPASTEPDTGNPDDADSPAANDISIGEIPTIEIMELTPDIARRALDSYIAAKAKYADADFEQFENLEDFVDQSADGPSFASDVRAAGFASVSDWNLAVTTLGLTYSSVIDDQSADLLLQIQEIEADDQLAQDMKDKMVKALKALIPSETNKKIVEDMVADPVYGSRLKQLDIEEE